MPANQIDFASIKESIGIDQVVQVLTIPKLQRHGDQFRAPCPQCKSGGDRALVVTTSKRSFYCFASKRGGDNIALAAHIQGTGQKEAAQWIEQRFQLGKQEGTIPRSRPAATSPEPTDTARATPVRAMEPLLYLDAHHEGLQDLGVSPETLGHFGAGYASKGTMRGRLAVPIHVPDGTLVAYCGIAVSEDQQPRLLFVNFDPTKALFNLHRVDGADGLYVARDPLDVLTAFENGIENVVSFLSPITSDALQVLSLFMETQGVENVEIL